MNGALCFAAVVVMAVAIGLAAPVPPAFTLAGAPDSILVTTTFGSVSRLGPFDTESKSAPAWCVTIELRAERPPAWLIALVAAEPELCPTRLGAGALKALAHGNGRPAPPRRAPGQPTARDDAGRPLYRIPLDANPRAVLDSLGRRQYSGAVWFDSAGVATRGRWIALYDSTGARRSLARLGGRP